MEEKKDEYSLGDILEGIKPFFLYLRRKWWVFLLVALLGAGLGVVYYSKQKPQYEAITTFILEEKSSGGGLAGLASQFGLNIGNNGGSLFSGDNILNILKSKKVVHEVLLSQLEDSIPGNRTLADLYLDFTGIKNGWKEKTLLANISFANSKRQLDPLKDSVLNLVYESIINNNLTTKRSSKQGSIIEVQITAENSLFARLMTERLVDEAAKLYFDIKTGTAEANIEQLQRRSDSLLIVLNRKSYSAAATQPLDLNPAMRTATVVNEIATRDKTVIATLYAEVTKNLEASKLVLSQQTPVIQVLDRPAYLLQDKKKGMKFWIIAFVGGATTLYVTLAFLYFLRNMRRAKYRDSNPSIKLKQKELIK